MGMMMRPKMEVVRFKQEDVIVASGHHDHFYANLNGWANGTSGDAIIHFKNGEDHEANMDALKGLLASGILQPDVKFYKTPDKSASLQKLIDNEETSGYDVFNGDYEKDTTTGNWYGYTRQ